MSANRMINTEKRRNCICTLILIALVLGICGYLEANKYSYSYAISIIERSMVYAVVAVSMNLVNGFTGLFSLGQAGFMALGAYVTAIFTIPVNQRASVYYISGIHPAIANAQLPVIVALILGGLVAAGVAALIGFPVLRLKSDYLAIATLGFAEIIRACIAAPQFDTITNGSYGLKSIPGFTNIFQPLALSAICIGLMVLLINSSYGRMFKAVREDEIAAEAMGINLFKTKELSFVISSFFAGVSGGMLAMFMRSIDSKTFQVALTYDILLIVVIGGIGSVTGSVIGAFIVTAGREILRFFDEPLFIGSFEVPLFRPGFRMVIFSILLMIVVLFYRKGLMGTNEFSWNGIFAFFKNPGKKKSKKMEGKA
ncbi:branched-chain amino acid ABC transporter permease [Oribacterium sp. WCC10]|uniref:branched-chain amino acid ABC transporter permease n=1 Tax=Oribacterium sp. WCC10 TaxID=1855343 RepID=UPI0008E0302A|nr:branched-chain amino acid ABC transporter permease [Oribacterium sp. WCC10]SFG31551.1 amino acid/amide ABC transporter membrane protein 2, HAAT family [Oribacterium sp. WCC10]